MGEPTFQEVWGLLQKTTDPEHKILAAILAMQLAVADIENISLDFIPGDPTEIRDALLSYKKDGFSEELISQFVGLPIELISSILSSLENKGLICRKN